jgi:hypothetical protein
MICKHHTLETDFGQFKFTEYFMPPTPQNVTPRYLLNLLRAGSNNEFTLVKLTRLESRTSNGHLVGHYYEARVDGPTLADVVGEGATPAAALRAALTLSGVTFR